MNVFPEPLEQLGVRPGKASASADRGLSIGNDVLTATWTTEGGVTWADFEDRLNSRSVEVVGPVFEVVVNGSPVAFHPAAPPRVERLDPKPEASRLTERQPGRAIVLDLADESGALNLTWSAFLRDGSNYLRLQLDVSGARVESVAFAAPCPTAPIGAVEGAPATCGSLFLGLEHPMARFGHGWFRLERAEPLEPGRIWTVSSVVGVAPDGQSRRGFLHYLERERAHPFRSFLHYNTWYDIGFFSRFFEADALDAIRAFTTELVRKRNVTLDSFLLDDGWDDPRTLWSFHDGFPEGFTNVRRAAEEAGAGLGVWLSPWGGYGKPKEERLARGAAAGFETNELGFALSGPVYYERFRDACVRMIREFGVNHFKFDGLGHATGRAPGSRFGSDFEAAIRLIEELRAERPDLYVNLTTGTWPSPFWLRFADSIWRGGEDHAFEGVGTDRRRWITYRDAETYRGIVRRCGLFPLNSLMIHGILRARSAERLDKDPEGAFAEEVWTYFGSGTQLQELYVTPGLLSEADWDLLARAARWARENAAVLRDTHWVGGDPGELEPYGWAAWSPERSVVTLRNPSDRERSFALDPVSLLELPANTDLAVRKVFGVGEPPAVLAAGRSVEVRLAPFEVLVVELAPATI